MNILFVCTGNTCRSPIAEGILKKMLKDKNGGYEVNSAGIYTHKGAVITPEAQKQLEKRGIYDMGGRKSVQISQELIDDSDLIFAMTGNQRRLLVESFPYAADKIHLLGDYTNRGGDVADPYGGNDAEYEKSAAEIEEMLGILVEMI